MFPSDHVEKSRRSCRLTEAPSLIKKKKKRWEKHVDVTAPFRRSKIMLVILMSRLRTDFDFWWCDHSEHQALWKCERHRLLRWCATACRRRCNAESMVQLDCKHEHNRPAKWPLVINYCLLTWNPLKYNPSLKTTIRKGKHSLDGKNWSVCRLAHFCFPGILGLTWWRLRDGGETADLTMSSSVSGSRLQLQPSWYAP